MEESATNLGDQFTEVARQNPKKTAVFWCGVAYSFGQSHGLAKRWAKRLQEEHKPKHHKKLDEGLKAGSQGRGKGSWVATN